MTDLPNLTRDSLYIQETYNSIQGEGSHSGLPCFFIRTAGCDLRCRWCDSPLALTTKDAQKMTIPEVLAKIPQDCALVQITGGEPLLQKKSIYELIAAIQKLPAKPKILLETGGHLSLDQIPSAVHIVMDIKLGSSGESAHPYEKNLVFLKKTDEIKFVIADEADFKQAQEWIKKYDLGNVCQLLVSTVWDKMPLKTLAELILVNRMPVRLQTQLHKLIWGDVPGI